MKRFISLAIVALMAATLFAGCGSAGDSSTESSKASEVSKTSESSKISESSASNDNSVASDSVDLNSILDEINAATGLDLEKVEEASRLKRYYTIEEGDVKQFAVERDKNNEVVLIEATDSDAADRIKDALEKKLDSLVNYSNSYSPEKAEQVKACKVTVDGNFVSLIVTDDPETALGIYQDKIK